ncbi:hypothetical protein EGW08_021496 [Elysia chlorotica]|uniref:Uncharacterized protein n=1 Tax=Elysia chlorotica TaxID=188477 RepID=A0A3S1ASD0_ELYCH|nr:hypothetical protein EGW08_021496 [Elysia chlorotica]
MDQMGITMFQYNGKLCAFPLYCLVWTMLTNMAAGQLNPSTVRSTTPDDGDFFDDDNNKAMYLVLPGMVLIYGGCAFIYCAHRCRRYCVRKSKAKVKEEKKRAKQKERVGFSNALVPANDSNVPSTSRHGHGVTVLDMQGHSTSMQLQSLEDDDDEMNLVFKKGRAFSSNRMQETNVDSIEDCLQTDNQNMNAVAPGYGDGNLSKEMMHLDNQLKAAFRLTQDTSKAAVPETGAAPSKSDKLGGANSTELQGATAAPPGKSPMMSKGAATSDSGNSSFNNSSNSSKVAETKVIPIAQEDIESILKIRKKVKKQRPPPAPLDLNLKSQPDQYARPDENVLEIKRLHIKASSGDKRRIFFSSQ